MTPDRTVALLSSMLVSGLQVDSDCLEVQLGEA
jgi:hypothetical protein